MNAKRSMSMPIELDIWKMNRSNYGFQFAFGISCRFVKDQSNEFLYTIV